MASTQPPAGTMDVEAQGLEVRRAAGARGRAGGGLMAVLLSSMARSTGGSRSAPGEGGGGRRPRGKRARGGPGL